MTMSKKQRWNDRQVKKYAGLHLFQSATLVTTNVPRTGLGSNPDLRGDRPATERPSYGTAYDQHAPELRLKKSVPTSQRTGSTPIIKTTRLSCPLRTGSELWKKLQTLLTKDVLMADIHRWWRYHAQTQHISLTVYSCSILPASHWHTDKWRYSAISQITNVYYPKRYHAKTERRNLLTNLEIIHTLLKLKGCWHTHIRAYTRARARAHTHTHTHTHTHVHAYREGRG